MCQVTQNSDEKPIKQMARHKWVANKQLKIVIEYLPHAKNIEKGGKE